MCIARNNNASSSQFGFMLKGAGGNSTKACALWRSAVRYFENKPKSFATLKGIIHDKSRGRGVDTEIIPSLRCILYYITKFVQTHAVVFTDCETSINVYERYRQMLRVHTKHLFDPFCRRTRYDLVLHGEKLQTNVGQLVFFKWFIDVGAYAHLVSVYDEVIADMRIKNKKVSPSMAMGTTMRPKQEALKGRWNLRREREVAESDSRRVVVRLAVHNNNTRGIRIAVHLD